MATILEIAQKSARLINDRPPDSLVSPSAVEGLILKDILELLHQELIRVQTNFESFKFLLRDASISIEPGVSLYTLPEDLYFIIPGSIYTGLYNLEQIDDSTWLQEKAYSSSLLYAYRLTYSNGIRSIELLNPIDQTHPTPVSYTHLTLPTKA